MNKEKNRINQHVIKRTEMKIIMLDNRMKNEGNKLTERGRKQKSQKNKPKLAAGTKREMGQGKETRGLKMIHR